MIIGSVPAIDARDALGDLVETLGDIGRAEDVPDVAQGERLAQVDPRPAVFLVEPPR
jgi:hypothetical protein